MSLLGARFLGVRLFVLGRRGSCVGAGTGSHHNGTVMFSSRHDYAVYVRLDTNFRFFRFLIYVPLAQSPFGLIHHFIPLCRMVFWGLGAGGEGYFGTVLFEVGEESADSRRGGWGMGEAVCAKEQKTGKSPYIK